MLEVTAEEHWLVLLDLQSRNDKEVVSENFQVQIYLSKNLVPKFSQENVHNGGLTLPPSLHLLLVYMT